MFREPLGLSILLDECNVRHCRPNIHPPRATYVAGSLRCALPSSRPPPCLIEVVRSLSHCSLGVRMPLTTSCEYIALRINPAFVCQELL